MSQTLGFQAAVEGLHLRDEGFAMMEAGSLIARLQRTFEATTGNKQFILESTTDALALSLEAIIDRSLDSIYTDAFDALERHHPDSTFLQFASRFPASTPASLLQQRTRHNENKYKFLQGYLAAKFVLETKPYLFEKRGA